MSSVICFPLTRKGEKKKFRRVFHEVSGLPFIGNMRERERERERERKKERESESNVYEVDEGLGKGSVHH